MLKKVYLEITNICNLACSFCPGTRREKRAMSPEEFERLAKKLRGHAEYLYFHLMGEPLTHPQLGELLETAGEQGFKVIITTNGTLLPERGGLLLESRALHKVNISLQSFEANIPGDLERYISSCASFAKSAAEVGELCVLRLWNTNGLDSLNGDIRSLLAESFRQPWTAERGSLKLSPRVWLEAGERFDWPELGAQDLGERRFCHGLRDQAGVLCDGTVVPCCLDHEGDIPLGNLFDTGLDEILASDASREIYDGFSQRRAVRELCRKCGYATRFD